jgi:hypothetical protein
MAYDLPFLDHHAQHRLNRQIGSLAREAGQISELLSRFSSRAQRDAGHYAHDVGRAAHELADEAWQQGAVAARVLGKQALRAGKAVRNDPIPAVVAVAGLACLLSLALASGRASTRRRQ